MGSRALGRGDGEQGIRELEGARYKEGRDGELDIREQGGSGFKGE